MKKLLIPALFVIIAAACATIKVTSDYDKSASFASYKTYTFTQEALNLNIEELNRKRLITAIENELALKGFTKAEKPDVLIDVKVSGEKKQTATATTSGGYGYGYGYYRYGWGGGTTTPSWNNAATAYCGSCHDGNGTGSGAEGADVIASGNHTDHLTATYGPNFGATGCVGNATVGWSWRCAHAWTTAN